MKEVSARRAQTRLALIEAATTVFAAKGVDVSVDEISAAAGFTRGAFYSNFSSKTELCTAVFDHYTNRSLTALRAAIPTDIKQLKSLDDVVDFVEKLIPFEDCPPDVALAMHTIWLAGIRDNSLRIAVLSRDAAAMSAAEVILTELFDQLGLKLRIPLEDVLMMLVSVNLSSMLDSLMTRQNPSTLLRSRLTAVINAVIVDFGQSDCPTAPTDQSDARNPAEELTSGPVTGEPNETHHPALTSNAHTLFARSAEILPTVCRPHRRGSIA